VAAAAGETARAHDDAYQALAAGRTIESQTRIIESFECLGARVLAADDPYKAVRVLGASDALRQAIGYQRFGLHQPGYDAAIAQLRSSLGEAAFGRSWKG